MAPNPSRFLCLSSETLRRARRIPTVAPSKRTRTASRREDPKDGWGPDDLNPTTRESETHEIGRRSADVHPGRRPLGPPRRRSWLHRGRRRTLCKNRRIPTAVASNEPARAGLHFLSDSTPRTVGTRLAKYTTSPMKTPTTPLRTVLRMTTGPTTLEDG